MEVRLAMQLQMVRIGDAAELFMAGTNRGADPFRLVYGPVPLPWPIW